MSADLFELVKSLTPPEKRHLQRHVTRKGTTNYERLYHVVAGQTTFDESEVRRAFQGQRVLRQLHVAKKYLYETVLRDLRGLYGKSSSATRLAEGLQNIAVLFQRDLLDQCLKQIRQSRKIASQFERFEIDLELCAWHRRVILTLGGPYAQRTTLDEISAREAYCLEQLTTIHRYRALAVKVASLGGGDEHFETQAFFADADPHSLRASILHAHLQSIQQVLNGSPDAADETLETLMMRLEQKPEWIADDPDAYISTINNRIVMALRGGQRDRVVGLLERIRRIPEQSKSKRRRELPVRTMLRTYNVQLELYRDAGDTDRGITLAHIVQKYLSAKHRSVPLEYRLLFYYQFAYLHYMASDFTQSLTWLNAIFKESWGPDRRDIQGMSRLLHLIIHFELGNFSLLRYAVESCRRFLSKTRRPLAYERRLLLLFSKLSVSRRDEHLMLFRSTRRDLFDAHQPLVTADVLDYLDIRTWLLRQEAIAGTRIGVQIGHVG